MDIEEQELHYIPEAPLLAWRLFRVRADGAGPMLSSPMYHDPEPPPWPGVVSGARCYEDHPAPAAGCRCGIYAAIGGTLDSLPGYLLDTSYDRDPWAYAEVACSGRVFADMRGVRAERAQLVSIALSGSAWSDVRAFEDARRHLRARYRVTVRGLEDVPAWVTANRRGQGPPPEEVKLDLDLGSSTLGVSSTGGSQTSAAGVLGRQDSPRRRTAATLKRPGFGGTCPGRSGLVQAFREVAEMLRAGGLLQAK